MTIDQSLPLTFEETLKYYLVPPRWYIRYRVWKEFKKGEKELALLPYLASPSKVSIDIGANRGVYTHCLGKTSSQVHAFEPNPKMYRTLQRTAPANAQTYQVALSNSAGEAIFRIPKGVKGLSNQRGTLRDETPNESNVEVRVETKRLDDYGFENVGFIKIDVEGFERQVIEGAMQTIRDSRPVILMEIEEMHSGEPLETSLERVTAMGYECVFLYQGQLHSLKSFDIGPHNRRVKQAGILDQYVFNFILLPG